MGWEIWSRVTTIRFWKEDSASTVPFEASTVDFSDSGTSASSVGRSSKRFTDVEVITLVVATTGITRPAVSTPPRPAVSRNASKSPMSWTTPIRRPEAGRAEDTMGSRVREGAGLGLPRTPPNGWRCCAGAAAEDFPRAAPLDGRCVQPEGLPRGTDVLPARAAWHERRKLTRTAHESATTAQYR